MGFTDREWERVGRLAARHGVSRSRYIADLVTGRPSASDTCQDLSAIAVHLDVRAQLEALSEALPRTLGPGDLLAVLARLDRIERALTRALRDPGT